MLIRPFTESETEQVVALWESCGLTRPWNDPRKDIARKLLVQRDLFLVGAAPEAPDTVVASAMAGYDGHRGWVYYLAVDPSRQAGGLGAEMMREVERRLEALGCPKVQLQVRSENDKALGFYARLGYETIEAGSYGKRLIAD